VRFGVGRCAGEAPYGSTFRSGTEAGSSGGVYSTLPGSSGSLWFAGHKTQAESPTRTRHRAASLPVEESVEQSLMLRGSFDFASRQGLRGFLGQAFRPAQCGRLDRLKEESGVLRRLPPRRLDSCKKLWVRVGPSSTIRVNHNVYSVDSRLIDEEIQVRLYAEHLEVCYGQRCLETIRVCAGKASITSSTGTLLTGWCENPGL